VGEELRTCRVVIDAEDEADVDPVLAHGREVAADQPIPIGDGEVAIVIPGGGLPDGGDELFGRRDRRRGGPGREERHHGAQRGRHRATCISSDWPCASSNCRSSAGESPWGKRLRKRSFSRAAASGARPFARESGVWAKA